MNVYDVSLLQPRAGRRIVQRHSGSLSYESVLGEGTTFTVTLPLAAK